MPITLEQLAQVAGVSVSTASRALSKSHHAVNPETRKRILTLAEQLGYRPNLMARSLKTERTYTIGLILDSILSPFSPLIIHGIQDHLKEFNYFSIVINTDSNPEVETHAVYDLISRSIDGIIFVESWMPDAHPILEVENKPYVFVHRLFGRIPRNSVCVDEQHGARLVIEHLIALGHHRIGYINGLPGWYASEQRLTGYRETLAAHEIPFDPEIVLEGDWGVQDGYRATEQFLQLSERPTAIFAANDLMALGAMYAIQDAGLAVPDDIAIVGYDDRDIASFARPTITTVRMPCYEMGQAAAKLVLNMLDTSRASNNSSAADFFQTQEPIKIPGELIVRESSDRTKRNWVQPRSHTTFTHLMMNRRRP